MAATVKRSKSVAVNCYNVSRDGLLWDFLEVSHKTIAEKSSKETWLGMTQIDIRQHSSMSWALKFMAARWVD